MRLLRLAALALDKSITRAADAFELTRGRVPPGLFVASFWPRLIVDLLKQIKRGSVIVTGTNGKTTTCRFLSSILKHTGYETLHTRNGSGSIEDVAASLIQAANPDGRIRADYGVFGFDETLLKEAVQACAPRVVVLNNLYRDGLFAGGPEGMARTWHRLFSTLTADRMLLLNADDPVLCGGFVRGVPPRVVYFGVEDEKLRVASRAAQLIRCHRCHAFLTYRLVSLGHLGDYVCSGCGWERPMPTVYAIHVNAGPDESRFRIITPVGPLDVRLRVPGVHNVYNAVAAAAAAVSLGINAATIRKGLEQALPPPGRDETVTIGNRRAHLMLVKNPTSVHAALQTVLKAPRPSHCLFLIDDTGDNSPDMSWLWEVDFEGLAGRHASVYVAGAGAEQIVLRLKHAGVQVTGILPDLHEAFHHAMRTMPQNELLRVMATGPVLFELRQELTDLGVMG